MNGKINLTAVFVQDKKSKNHTAFFAQFPNIIAEGANEGEALDNLFNLVNIVFDYQRNKELNAVKSIKNSEAVKTRSLVFSYR